MPLASFVVLPLPQSMFTVVQLSGDAARAGAAVATATAGVAQAMPETIRRRETSLLLGRPFRDRQHDLPVHTTSALVSSKTFERYHDIGSSAERSTRTESLPGWWRI